MDHPAEAACGALELGGVYVQTDQSTGGFDVFKQLTGVPAVSDRAIHHNVPLAGMQRRQDFLDQDWNVSSRGRAALGTNMLVDPRMGSRV